MSLIIQHAYFFSLVPIHRWDRPNEEVAAALEARIQQANSQVDEAVQRRKEEFKREKQQQEDRDAQVAQLQVRKTLFFLSIHHTFCYLLSS